MATVAADTAPSSHRTPEERAERGRAARSETPRSSHADWSPAKNRPDPIAMLERQAATRVPELLPIRYGRMAASPFAFYRGGAYIMGSDLANTPVSGMRAQLCGDAHLSNFGGFASPERDLIFDLNDFDETLPGPWEWDVKRLAASVAIAGRDRGFSGKQRRSIVQSTVRVYREAMHRLAGMGELAIWYERVDAGMLRDRVGPQATARQLRTFEKTVAKGRRKDSTRAFTKLATTIDAKPRIVADPPLLVPIRDLLPEPEEKEFRGGMESLLEAYRSSLPLHLCHLLDRYEFVDLARKVVGVGSVGTRAWVILLVGRDGEDAVMLQAKEAQASVLEPYLGRSEFATHGERVVRGQRMMQAATDIFLSWQRSPSLDGVERDFYVRQLWDWKASADLSRMTEHGLLTYTRACAWSLARSHARSGDRLAIAAYLGKGNRFDRAIARFAEVYADQNDADYRRLVEAEAAGEVQARRGI